MSTSPNPTQMCWICGTVVDLKTCKTDEHGNVVHGKCYAAKMALAREPQQSAKKVKIASPQMAKTPSCSVNHGSMLDPVRHYHVRWQGSKLDWEAFQTQEAAETHAAALALPNEAFSVEQFDGNCPKCNEFRKRLNVQVTDRAT